jgi:hypothetical protein
MEDTPMRLTKIIQASFLVVLFGVFGCEKDSPLSSDNSVGTIDSQMLAKVSANGGETQIADLIANRTLDVGDVSFDDVDLDNDGTADALQVCYTTTGGWELVSTDLWIGHSLSDMPDTRKGDPKPCRFPYHSRRISDTSWCVTIPFEGIAYQCGDSSAWYVAAHAVVKKVEGKRKHRTANAWSGDTRFREKRGHWATFTTIVIDCDRPVEPPPVLTHPAFAYSPADNATCFLDMGQSQWGWTNFIAEPGTYTHLLYADATMCNAANGTVVGTVTVVYDGSTATVTFETTGPYNMNQTAVYVGPDEMAFDQYGNFTADPNLFPYVHTVSSVTTDTYTITDVSAPFFFVAHAAVGGF